MKRKTVFLMIMMAAVGSCFGNTLQEKKAGTPSENELTGKWVRIGPTGPMALDFRENGQVEVDFGNDKTIDLVASYELSGDTISFTDQAGAMCQEMGRYKIFQTEYYLAFDLIDDDCPGRIKTTMGFWTKPNFREMIQKLDKEIATSPNPELHLNRARIYLAVGMVDQARVDFDHYLLTDTANARVYINRAGTRFPADLKGVVSDCNKAIALQPDNKNAYFLRGMARYELGEEEQGCEDFRKAITLGFSILRIAEQEKCIDYWETEE